MVKLAVTTTDWGTAGRNGVKDVGNKNGAQLGLPDRFDLMFP